MSRATHGTLENRIRLLVFPIQPLVRTYVFPLKPFIVARIAALTYKVAETSVSWLKVDLSSDWQPGYQGAVRGPPGVWEGFPGGPSLVLKLWTGDPHKLLVGLSWGPSLVLGEPRGGPCGVSEYFYSNTFLIHNEYFYSLVFWVLLLK